MQPKEYIKNKARKLVKQTWAGPGKFGVLIVVCLIVIAFFESMGLSNREKNLELRNVQTIVIPMNYSLEKMNEGADLIKNQATESLLKHSAQIESTRKNMEREKLLLFGAIEQYLFEHKEQIENYENIETANDKTKQFFSMIFEQKEEIIDTNAEDIFLFDI